MKWVAQNSKAGRGFGNAEPDLLHVAVGAAHMMKQADGRDRCEHADHRGQSHEAKIVLMHDAAIYGQHFAPFPPFADYTQFTLQAKGYWVKPGDSPDLKLTRTISARLRRKSRYQSPGAAVAMAEQRGRQNGRGDANRNAHELPLRAVKPLFRTRNGMTGLARLGPSWGDPCRRAYRPTEASTAVVCYVRSTSTPVISGANRH